MPNSLGPGELLQHYGTDDRKIDHLPRLARGQEIPCFALTSPGAGSDAGAIPDTGIVCIGEWQGQQVLGMRLTWNKRLLRWHRLRPCLGWRLNSPTRKNYSAVQRFRHYLCADPNHHAGRGNWSSPLPAERTVPDGPTRGEDSSCRLITSSAGRKWRARLADAGGVPSR
ncbi:hypothetical protein ACLK1T_06090 [Escherichia coli]